MTVKWLDPMMRWDEFIKMRQAARDGGGPILVFGLSESQKSHAVSSLLYPLDRQCLYITYNHIQAQSIYNDLKFYMEDDVMLLPPRDIVLYVVAAHSTDVSGQRLKVLEAFALGEIRVVVASIEALLCLQTPPEIFRKGLIRVEVGQILPLDSLAHRMVELGYERVPTVEGPGQFSIRGGIVDIYPLTMDGPCRIEFFDDEVDSIRLFDPLSQRSTDKLAGVSISSARELVLTPESLARGIEGIRRDFTSATRKGKGRERLKERVSGLLEDMEQGIHNRNLENYFPFFYPENNTFFDYLSPETLVVLDEPSRIGEGFTGWEEEFIEHFSNLLEDGEVLPGQGELFIPYHRILSETEKFHRLALQGLPKSIPGYSPRAIFNITTRGIPSYQGKLDMLAEDLKYWREKKYSVILYAGSGSRCQNLVSNLYDRGVEATYSPSVEGQIRQGQIIVLPGSISAGFEYPQGRFAVVSHNEIFGAMKHRRKRKATSGKGKLDPFTDLKVGDYVVHEAHGIGSTLV